MTAERPPAAMAAALRALGIEGKAAPPEADATSVGPEEPEDDAAGFDAQLQAFGLRRLGRLWPGAPSYPRKQLMEEVAFIAFTPVSRFFFHLLADLDE